MQEVRPTGQGRHGKHWEAAGDEGGRDGGGETEGSGRSRSLNGEGKRLQSEIMGGSQWCGARGMAGQGRRDSAAGCGVSRRKQRGTRRGNNAQTRGLPVVKHYLRERYMSKNLDISCSP